MIRDPERYPCGHLRTPENTYPKKPTSRGKACRECNMRRCAARRMTPEAIENRRAWRARNAGYSRRYNATRRAANPLAALMYQQLMKIISRERKYSHLTIGVDTNP